MVKMILTQILLPIYDNTGKRFSRILHREVKLELSEKFGGLTAYSRSPAEGLWKRNRATRRDDIIVYEVMARRLNGSWWSKYRKELERRFRQSVVVIRAEHILVM